MSTVFVLLYVLSFQQQQQQRPAVYHVTNAFQISSSLSYRHNKLFYHSSSSHHRHYHPFHAIQGGNYGGGGFGFGRGIHQRPRPNMEIYQQKFPNEIDSSVLDSAVFVDEINGELLQPRRRNDEDNGNTNDNVENNNSDDVIEDMSTIRIDDELRPNDEEAWMTSSSTSSTSPSSCVINFDDISQPYMSRMDSESTFVDFTDDGVCVPAGPMGQWKEKVANFLVEPSAEIVIASVVLLNSLLVALSTLDQLDPYMSTIQMAQNIVEAVFIADFLGRWFSSSRETGRFVVDGQFALDVLVVILPFVVSITPPNLLDQLPSALTRPSGLFNLQLLRVLRLQRFLKDLDTFEKFCDRALGKLAGRVVVQEWQLQLSRVLLSLFTLLSVSTGLIYTAENEINPGIDNYFDALYFGLTTLTTVGLGDVAPITWQGKLVVCGSILLGVAVVPSQAASLVEALLDREQIRNGGKSRIRPGGMPQSSSSLTTSQRRVDSSSLGSGNDNNNNNIMALDTSIQCPNCGSTFHWTNAQYCYNCGEELDT